MPFLSDLRSRLRGDSLSISDDYRPASGNFGSNISRQRRIISGNLDRIQQNDPESFLGRLLEMPAVKTLRDIRVFTDDQAAESSGETGRYVMNRYPSGLTTGYQALQPEQPRDVPALQLPVEDVQALQSEPDDDDLELGYSLTVPAENSTGSEDMDPYSPDSLQIN